jgi:hypothetical protein
MDESRYFGLQGIRKRPSIHVVASLIEDFVNDDYVHFDDLSFRYGLKIDEINEIIDFVLPKTDLNNCEVIVRQSAV